jgi:hypothetical protein
MMFHQFSKKVKPSEAATHPSVKFSGQANPRSRFSGFDIIDSSFAGSYKNL